MWLISLAIISALLALIFKFLPDVALEWSDVVIGAILTSLMFTAGKVVLRVYLIKAAFADSYGAGGSLVILLVWVYYSAQVFFSGLSSPKPTRAASDQLLAATQEASTAITGNCIRS